MYEFFSTNILLVFRILYYLNQIESSSPAGKFVDCYLIRTQGHTSIFGRELDEGMRAVAYWLRLCVTVRISSPDDELDDSVHLIIPEALWSCDHLGL
jgi:hypothetical protein